MASVQEISDQYTNNILIHPPGLVPGVCPVCRTWISGGYPLCYRCNEVRTTPGFRGADVVVPIGLAVKGQQFAHELWNYKDSKYSASTAQAIAVRLTCVLWRFIVGHESCVARAAYVGRSQFDVVTMVPSASGRNGEHPLRQMLGTSIAPTRQRYADLLEPTLTRERDHEWLPDRYHTTDRPAGKSVLLIDDTWTSGVHAQSAVGALKDAGATRVAVIVLGRHIDPGYADHAARAREVQRQPFSWDSCCVHELPQGLW